MVNMTEKIRFLREKGKYVSKEELKFYSTATLEQLEQAERNKKVWEFAWLDGLDARGEIDPDNPPNIWAITFQRWLLGKRGLKWVADYLKRREYKDNPAGIPGRLQALGVSSAEIEAVMNPLAALRKKLSKICAVANRIPRSVSRKEAFAQARRIVEAGSIELKVAGVTFGNRQTALKRLAAYDPAEIRVALTPEPENPADKNAVAVMVSVNGGNQYRIGYVPAENTGMARAFQGNVCIQVLPGDVYGARLRLAV
jgi:hypothetical protein